MTTLDRYFGKRLAGAFVRTTLAFVMLFILIDLLATRRDYIMRYDVPWDIVLRYYAVYVPQLLYKFQVAALSLLVSTLLVFGNAAQNNEITAALAGGISLRRLVRVPVILAGLLAVGLYGFQDTLGVLANREADRLDQRYFSRSTESARPGVSWANLQGNWTVHVMKFNRAAMTGENVFMHSIRPEAVEQIQARRIFWEPSRHQWLIEDGRWFTFDPNQQWQGEVRRITQRPAPFTETPAELFALDASPDTKTTRELLDDIRQAEGRGAPAQSAWTDFHAKFAQPALSFVMIWLAIPFAMRLRRGGLAIGFGASVGFALIYIMVFRVSMGMGHLEKLTPWAAAWLANIVFFIMGVVFFRKTPT